MRTHRHTPAAPAPIRSAALAHRLAPHIAPRGLIVTAQIAHRTPAHLTLSAYLSRAACTCTPIDEAAWAADPDMTLTTCSAVIPPGHCGAGLTHAQAAAADWTHRALVNHRAARPGPNPFTPR